VIAQHPAMRHEASRIRRNLVLAVFGWTLVVAASLGWGIHGVRQETLKLAQHEANAYIDKDIAFRNWATSHGGVYVPPSETTPPNPYLSHIPDRDVTTTGGKQLTLMNPAYMLREMQSRFAGPLGEKGRITSLKPLNPINAPDDWERVALLRLEQGSAEVSEVSDIDGVPHLRKMRPFVVEQGCLKCHGHQGYRVGDIRGGIDVAISLIPFNRIARQTEFRLAAGHGVIWFIGLVVIAFFTRRAVQHQAERAAAEASIRKLNEELEGKVQQRTQQLQAAQAELVRKEKLAMLGQVAGNVGHELRNPLGVMSNAVYFLQTVLPDADDSVKEYLNIIKHEIAGSERIVADLLDAVRTRPPQAEAVGIGQLVGQVLSQYSVPAAVAVKLDIPPTLPPVQVDVLQMQQAMRNLIHNGVEAMPEGGTLEIRAVENRPDATVTVSVRDTGTGMTQEQLGHLFQPLYTTKARGIGLGLVVAQNLVQANGGSIEVQSAPGRGACFSITLTIADKSERTHDWATDRPLAERIEKHDSGPARIGYVPFRPVVPDSGCFGFGHDRADHRYAVGWSAQCRAAIRRGADAFSGWTAAGGVRRRDAQRDPGGSWAAQAGGSRAGNNERSARKQSGGAHTATACGAGRAGAQGEIGAARPGGGQRGARAAQPAGRDEQRGVFPADRAGRCG
jgi:signal transduction histidine kinase